MGDGLRVAPAAATGVEVARKCGVVSTASMTTSNDGMVQLDIDDRCSWMDECGAVVLSGVMVASTVDPARSLRTYLL